MTEMNERSMKFRSKLADLKAIRLMSNLGLSEGYRIVELAWDEFFGTDIVGKRDRILAFIENETADLEENEKQVFIQSLILRIQKAFPEWLEY